MATMRVIVREQAIREFIKTALTSKGRSMLLPESEGPIKTNDVVDTSAAITDPGNEDYKPNNRIELQVAVKALTDDVPDDKVADFYDKLTGAINVPVDNDDEDTKMQKKDTKTEAAVRRAVRRHLQDHLELGEAFTFREKKLGPVVGELPPVQKIPMGTHGGEYTRQLEKSKAKLKQALKSDTLDDFGGAQEDDDAETPEKRTFSTMSDVQGASFQEIANELGFSVAGAKQAVDKALAKAQWVGMMQEKNPEDLEIMMLTAMNDYIKYLSKSGELSAADIQLMKDHPEVVQTLPGYREYIDKVIRKARKGTELEDPLGESKKINKGGILITLKKMR